MARGWESKSVESQQDAAAHGSPRPKASMTAADAARQTARATVMLARTHALANLQAACSPAHRSMLEQAIAALDKQLAGL